MDAQCVVPPSPNWYGAHLASEHPHEPLLAYAGHETVVIVRYDGDDDDGGGGSGGGDGKSGGGSESGPPSILRCLAPHPARVSSLTFAPAPLHAAQEDDEEGDGSDPTTTSSSGGGRASADQEPPPPMLLVCGCEDGTAVCWDVSRGVRTRSARRYRSELSAVAIVSLQGAAEAAAPPSAPPPAALPLAIFGDSAGRLLAWSYREGERSKPDPLAAKLPDHGGVVCLAAAPPPQQQQQQQKQLLFVGCRDGTVACVELGPVDGGGEAPCASSVRYVFSPHERAGGGRAAAARTTTATAAAAAAGASRPGGPSRAASAAASAAALPASDATVQALDCVAAGSSGDANCLLLLTGTAAGGLALWDVWADQCSAVGAAAPSSPPRRLAHASLQRPAGGGGGQGGGKQVPWTAARVVPGSFRVEEDGVASCVVAAGAHGGALVLQRLAWQAASGDDTSSLRRPSAATRPMLLARTRAAHARPVFGVCFPAGRARTMASISMDRSVVLSRMEVAAAAAATEVAGAAGTTGEGRGTAAATASQQSSSIQPFWSTQGLGGYAYAMDARLGVLAIACGDRSLRLVRLLSHRRGTAAAIEGEPLEIVWAGGTSKLLCCAWSPAAGSMGLLAWGDGDGRVGVLAVAVGPKRGGDPNPPSSSSSSRLVPFAAARHGGPALQLSWSPELPAPCLYSLGGEGCLLRWPAAAAVDSAEEPPPLDVAPALHAAVRSSSAAALSSTRLQWTAVAWHPTLPLLAAGADDGAIAVFSASRADAEGEAAAAAAADDDNEDGGASPAPAWRLVGFHAPPGSSSVGRVRRVCWAAPPSPSADGGVEGDEGRPPLLAAVGARHVLVLRVGAAAPDGSPAAEQAMPAAAVCVPSGAEGAGGSGEDAMDAAWWLPVRGGSEEAGGDDDDNENDDDDPYPLLVVGLANGGLRAWRVRTSSSSFSAPPLLVPAAADAGGGLSPPPRLPSHAGAVQCLLPVALDGKNWLLSGSRDQSVRAWRAQDLVRGVGHAVGGEGEATAAVAAVAAPRVAAAALPIPALGGSAATSQRNWRRLLPAGNKQAMPEPPFSRTPEERAACLAAVLALAREVLPLPGEEEEEEDGEGERGSGGEAATTARLLALMVADADAVAADPELQQGMSAERRAAIALWRGDARTALGGGGSSLGAEAALLAAGAGGAAAWRAATAAAAVSAEAAGQQVVAALLRRIAAEGVTDLEDDPAAQKKEDGI